MTNNENNVNPLQDNISQVPAASEKIDNSLIEAARDVFLGKKEPFEFDEKNASPKEEAAPPKAKKEEYTEIEKEAMKLGWRKKEDMEWKDAATWLENIPDHKKKPDEKNVLLNRIDAMERTQKEMFNLLMAERQQKIDEKINAIKAKRNEAIMERDVEKVNKCDEEIEQLKGNVQKSAAPYPAAPNVSQPANTPTPETQEFISRNKDWFNQDSINNRVLSQMAVDMDNEFAKQYPTMPLNLRLKMVEDRMHEQMTDYKKNHTSFITHDENIVTTSPNKYQSEEHKTVRFDDFPSDIQGMIDNFVNNYNMKARNPRFRKILKPLTREDYIEQLVKDKTIDKQGNYLDKNGKRIS